MMVLGEMGQGNVRECSLRIVSTVWRGLFAMLALLWGVAEMRKQKISILLNGMLIGRSEIQRMGLERESVSVNYCSTLKVGTEITWAAVFHSNNGSNGPLDLPRLSPLGVS